MRPFDDDYDDLDDLEFGFRNIRFEAVDRFDGNHCFILSAELMLYRFVRSIRKIAGVSPVRIYPIVAKTTRKAGVLQILCCQGIRVDYSEFPPR